MRADETYVRESILYPDAKVVEGYKAIMPTFKGLVTEDGLLKLIEYVKSIGQRGGPRPGARAVTSGSQPKTPAQERTNPSAVTVPGNR